MNRRRFVNGTGERVERLTECLSCGAVIGGTLSVLGSLRCLDCRSANRPLDPELVQGGAPVSALSSSRLRRRRSTKPAG